LVLPPLLMQKNTFHNFQSFRSQECRHCTFKILKWRNASPFKWCDLSLNSQKSNKGVDDKTNDSFDNDANDIEKQSLVIRSSKTMEGKRSTTATKRWFLPRLGRRRSHGEFDSGRVVAESTARTSTKIVDTVDHVGAVGILAWMISLSTFVLVNNFIGPWPKQLFDNIPFEVWLLGHQLGGMIFGGGVILTTCIERLVAESRNIEVMRFWFEKVPWLNTAIVLPGLTISIFSGTGLATLRYGGLSNAPPHVIHTFWGIVIFAAWWGFTDLTTQGEAFEAILKLEANEEQEHKREHGCDSFDISSDAVEPPSIVVTNDHVVSTPTTSSSFASLSSSSPVLREVPKPVNERMSSNAVSCLFVLLLYAIMVLKLGTVRYW